MFGVSSSFPAGTLGRKGVWILTCGVALLGTVIAYRQPAIIDKSHDQVPGPEDETEESDERTRLLPRAQVEV